MGETPEQRKMVIVGTRSDRASLPFVVGNAALSMGVGVVVVLQGNGVFLAKEGYARPVHGAGFPPLEDLLQIFAEAGGRLMACSPCLQARRIEASELRGGVEVVAGATLVAESLAAHTTLTY